MATLRSSGPRVYRHRTAVDIWQSTGSPFRALSRAPAPRRSGCVDWQSTKPAPAPCFGAQPPGGTSFVDWQSPERPSKAVSGGRGPRGTGFVDWQSRPAGRGPRGAASRRSAPRPTLGSAALLGAFLGECLANSPLVASFAAFDRRDGRSIEDTRAARRRPSSTRCAPCLPPRSRSPGHPRRHRDVAGRSCRERAGPCAGPGPCRPRHSRRSRS